MPSIQSLGYPLAYKTVQGPGADERDAEAPGSGEPRVFCTSVRSLEGMQKEAVVAPVGDQGSTWRMVSDEGPYLDGTDLAPFPLAFFTAGLQFCFMEALLRYARSHRIPLGRAEVVLENRYSMKGSFLRGDAKGGAEPADLRVRVESTARQAVVETLARASLVASPAHAAMREPLADTFSLVLNGGPVVLDRRRPSPRRVVPDPLQSTFAALAPVTDRGFLPYVISKVAAAESVHGVEGGAGSSLAPVQDRTLHVRGDSGFVRANGGEPWPLKETVVRLFRPIGSSFRFLSDEGPEAGGQDGAPPALAYLSAGIGFCFMTQISRYAHILKLNVRSIRIVQFTGFSVLGSPADWSLAGAAEPVDTHVFIDADEPEGVARKVIEMGEQTCFLHAALGASLPSRIHAGAEAGAAVPDRRDP